VLEAITKSADSPIGYAIVDYGIEFTLKGPDQVQLHTRTFRVDPNTFYMGLQNHGVNVTNLITAQTPSTGSSGTQAGRGLRHVNGLIPNTEMQLAFVNFFSSIGVNLAAPKSFFFKDRQGTITVRATDEDLELIEKALDTMNIAPAQVTVKVRAVEINDEDALKPKFEWLLKMLPDINDKGPAKVSGIITEPLLRTLLKRLDQRQSLDLLSEAEVTTLSGREAEIELNIGLTNNNPLSRGTGKFLLDIVPNVAADGYTIQMALIPTVELRFQGTNSAPSNGGIPITGSPPPPRSLARQAPANWTANCVVWDGQTAVLSSLSFYEKNQTRHVVIILVTPVVIDAVGNRKNSDESLLFAQKAVPEQPKH